MLLHLRGEKVRHCKLLIYAIHLCCTFVMQSMLVYYLACYLLLATASEIYVALAVVCIMCLLDYFVTTRLLQGSMKEKALKKRIHFIDLLFSPSVWMIIVTLFLGVTKRIYLQPMFYKVSVFVAICNALVWAERIMLVKKTKVIDRMS